MSLGIAFKGPEGIVLAADSRVTLSTSLPNGLTVPSSFDNAIKLLGLQGQAHVGMVTYGQGAVGLREPRTAHSFLPELEAELAGGGRLPVEEFAQRVSDFYLERWNAASMPAGADSMFFLVAGFDEGAAYGRVFSFDLPNTVTPSEEVKDDFGLRWGGQTEIVQRMLVGYDAQAIAVATKAIGLDASAAGTLQTALTADLSLRIPYQFLPLQDCVDLAVFLVRATATLQQWTLGLRGVGGPIDVATITRTDGFRAIQAKTVRGERPQH
jgi:hypothetical protein